MSPLLPPGWQELQPLVDELLDLPPVERPARIAQLAAGDAARATLLTEMLAACERGLPLMQGSAAQVFAELTPPSDGAPLPERLADRYVTGRELGRGGMARVYLARDTKHGRDVAIKVLRPEISAAFANERFTREIDIAAKLRHPNIVPLYDSGDVNGALYFVMPFEDGPSLRERLRDGPLSIADATSVLRDIARALAYAHERGVVHRDVKPDNVMLSGGAAVVTDFGIAKAISVALTDGGRGPTLTQMGVGIGTPAYMAPEQATGDPSTDHRADIYAFGCLAFELFAGTPPFHGLPTHQVISAHVSTVPPPVTTVRADVPPAIAAIIARCLEKAPEARPQSMRDVLAVFDGLAATGTTTRAVRTRMRRPVVLALGGAAAAVLAAGAWFATRGVGGVEPLTIAVLPFNQTDTTTSIEFVVEGLADEVASALTPVSGVQVKSRSGARLYRGELGVDVTEAGARLKSAYIVTGVMRQDRGSWILSTELARASDAASLWGASFRIDSSQVAGAPQQIADSIMHALDRAFPGRIGLSTIGRGVGTTDNVAVGLYMHGQELLNKRGQSVQESGNLFRQAIARDPKFARAYSGLSLALALTPHFHSVKPTDVRAELESVANRALALDSTLSQPHVARGLALQFARQWDSAAVEYRRAIVLDARDVEARVQYARHLLFRGRTRDAMSQLRAAQEQDPESAVVLSWIAYTFYVERRLDSAMVLSARALENGPANFTSLSFGVGIRLAAGRMDEARALLSRAPAQAQLHGYAFARLGDVTAARLFLQRQEAEQPWQGLTRRAFTHLGLGERAQTIALLEAATDSGEMWYVIDAITDPKFDSIRSDPKFVALVRRVGLQEALTPQ